MSDLDDFLEAIPQPEETGPSPWENVPDSNPDMWTPQPGEVPGTGGMTFPDQPKDDGGPIPLDPDEFPGWTPHDPPPPLDSVDEVYPPEQSGGDDYPVGEDG
jgi:hypothetical protein